VPDEETVDVQMTTLPISNSTVPPAVLAPVAEVTVALKFAGFAM
jgi:hypothetical protein